MMVIQAASTPMQVFSSIGPSFVSQMTLTQSDSDESFVSRLEQPRHRPQIIVSPPSQEFTITNNIPVIKSSTPPPRPAREARPATPESEESAFEDASDSFFDADASPIPLDEDEDQVDPEFHGKQVWKKSASLEDLKNVAAVERPTFARSYSNNSEMRRPRSHFSIPDVVVTSSEEEGEEMHFEIEVEPTRRTMIFPSQVSGRELEEVEMIKQKHASKTSGGLFKKKRKPPLIYIDVSEMPVIRAPGPDTPTNSSAPSERRSSLAQRMRKSSLSSLFGRREKDKESSPPPPSPTLPAEWQGTISPPLDSPISPASSIETPLSAGTSPAQSPVTLTFQTKNLNRSQSKKDLKAKMKEEKALIKERERVDKLVKKHDKLMQKAAAKQNGKEGIKNTDGTMTSSSSSSSNESPKKKRATVNGKKQISAKKSANMKAMKAADFAARHITPPTSYSVPPPRPMKAATRSYSNDSKSSNENAPPSKQSKIIVEAANVKPILRPSSVHNVGKRKSGTSFKASNGVSSSSQRVSFVRKRLSSKNDAQVEKAIVSKSPEPVIDDAMEEVVEDEEIGIENMPPVIASTKRMTLLESLYKDIEEMEMRFEEENSISSGRVPISTVANTMI